MLFRSYLSYKKAEIGAGSRHRCLDVKVNRKSRFEIGTYTGARTALHIAFPITTLKTDVNEPTSWPNIKPRRAISVIVMEAVTTMTLVRIAAVIFASSAGRMIKTMRYATRVRTKVQSPKGVDNVGERSAIKPAMKPTISALIRSSSITKAIKNAIYKLKPPIKKLIRFNIDS